MGIEPPALLTTTSMPPKASTAVLDEVVERVQLADVAGHDDGLAAGGPDVGGHLLELALGAGGEDQVGPDFGVGAGDGGADAAPATGHDDDLAVQSEAIEDHFDTVSCR